MSETQTKQTGLNGESKEHPTKGHLSKVKACAGVSKGTSMTAEKNREWFCVDCGRRVTEGPDGKEFGHQRKRASAQGRCPRRDEYLGEDL